MPTKQYIKKLNGFYIKDEEARNRAEEVDDRVDTTNERIDSMDYGALKFHSVAASKACYVVEFPNGKNMLIDTGQASEWSDIQTAINGLGIEKFDYFVLTHFHDDHVGNVQNFINGYEMPDTCYIQMKPDFTNHAADIVGDTEAAYDAQVALLASNGITAVVPTNGSIITIDEDNAVSIRFLNTDSTIAANYYGRYAEWINNPGSGTPGINNNAFSIITEIIHHNVKILQTGDIETPTEEQFAQTLGKVNLMTAPHHGSNRDAYRAFYYATKPDYYICSDPDLIATSVRSFMKGRQYLKDAGSQFVSPINSKATNGLYSFESNGYSLESKVLDGALTENSFNFNNAYQEIDGLVKWSSQISKTMTLEQLIANLPQGFDMSEHMTDTIRGNYEQVVSDLAELFGQNGILTYLTIRKRRLLQEITIFDIRKHYTAIRNTYPDGTTTDWKIKGEGTFVEYVVGRDNLLSLINRLPIGHYALAGYKESDSTILATGSNYGLTIDVIEKSSSGVTAKISAIIRDDAADLSYLNGKAIAAEAFYKSATTPATLSWRQTL